jgi:hypothetical protein
MRCLSRPGYFDKLDNLLSPEINRSMFPPAFPAKMCEARKRKCLWLPFSTSLSILRGEPPKLDQSCFLRMWFQAELGESFPKRFQESLGYYSVFEDDHQVIGVADDNHISRSHFPAPGLDPQVEDCWRISRK